MERKDSEININIIQKAIVGIAVTLFFSGIIFMYYNMVYEEKRNGIIKDGRMAAGRASEQFDRYLSTNKDIIEMSAYRLDGMIEEDRADEEIAEYLVNESTAVRSAIQENYTGLYGYINNRFFSGTNWEPPEGYDATVRPWYTKPMENPGELTILEPYEDVQTGNTMLALGKTLCDGESVISVDVSLDRMQILTEEAVKEGGSDIEMILAGDGTVVTHSDINEVGKNYCSEKGTLGAEIVDRIDQDDEGYCEFDFGGMHYIAYYSRFQNDWNSVSVHNVTSVFSSLKKILVMTIAVVIAIVITIGILLFSSVQRKILAERAVASNEAKTLFLSNVSHEIRTPINAVMGMNEMILRECTDEKILGYSEKIKKSAITLLTLVNEMLQFSMSEENRAFDNPELHGEIQKETDESFIESVSEDNGGREAFRAPDAEILAVDDNPMNLEVLRSLLRQTGVRIDTAGSGDQGLLCMSEKKYDIILLDHMMPEKDGIETLHEMRSVHDGKNIDTPVICLTANAIKGAREYYLDQGFNDYLTKPIVHEKLEELLIKYLPEEKVEKTVAEETAESKAETKELPPALKDLQALNILDVEAGIENSGTAEAYLSLLRLFYSAIDEKLSELNRFYSEKDLKNYTIKVHALKSSANIIGATKFGEESQEMENAGKRDDLDYIEEHHDEYIEKFKEFREPLRYALERSETDRDKPPADKELMDVVLEEIRSAADEMDCEKLFGIFKEMEEYSIPEDMAGLWKKLKEATDTYDYGLIIKLFDEAGKD